KKMRKVILSDGTGRWFDIDSAKEFRSASYIDNSGEEVCPATGGIPGLWAHLYLTEHGTFILVHTYDGYHPEADGAVEMDVDSAVRWLLNNGHQDELKKLDLGTEESR